MSLDRVRSLLLTAQYRHAIEVSSGLTAGALFLRPLAAERTTDVTPLIEIYSAREEHLRTKRSVHAVALAEDCRALVAALNLRRGERALWWRVDSTGSGPDFLVLTDESGDVIIGSLRVYSKLKTTPERWAELWAD